MLALLRKRRNGARHLFLIGLELINGLCDIAGHLVLAGLELFNRLLQISELARHRLKRFRKFRRGRDACRSVCLSGLSRRLLLRLLLRRGRLNGR